MYMYIHEAPIAQNHGCGSWIRAGQRCYQMFPTPKLSWDDSRAQCRANNGDLMNVKDLDTQVSHRLLVLKHIKDNDYVLCNFKKE